MPVNFLNLPGLNVLDFKETATDYPVKAEPVVISCLCPHCGRSNETVKHEAWAVGIARRISDIESGAVQVIPIADALAQVRAALK